MMAYTVYFFVGIFIYFFTYFWYFGSFKKHLHSVSKFAF